VSLTEAQWDTIRFGKYADATGGKNTLTIEMGDQKWTYTFDKRLATDADILSAVKAAKDASETITPYYLGNQTIDFYVQDTEPVPNKVGDVWVKTNEILMQNNVILNETQPTLAQDKQIWQTISGLDYTLNLEKVSAFFDRSEGELHIEIDSKSLLSSIPQNKVLLWKNVYSKAFGDLSDVHYWDLATNKWVKVEAFMWDGISWVQISFELGWLYSEGVESVTFIEGNDSDSGYYSSVSKESDHLHLKSTPKDGSLSEQVSYVTEIKVDVTDFTALNIDWENVGEGTTWNGSLLNVTTEQRSGKNTYTAQIYHAHNAFPRTVESLDVSSLSGEFFIKVFALGGTGQTASQSIVNVYNLWLE
jgi:hypothetical protein